MVESNSKSLRFAATHALSLTFMPGWLRSFEAHTMAGTLQLESDMLHRCEALLAQSKVQFVLCHVHERAPTHLQMQGYPSICVGADVLRPVCATGLDGLATHSLHRRASPAFLLNYSSESGLGTILGRTIEGPLAKIPTQTVFTAHLASVLRTMALEGRGIAWLPQSLIRDDLSERKLVSAGSEDWDVKLQIRMYRSHSPLGHAAESLWEAVVQSVQSSPDQKT